MSLPTSPVDRNLPKGPNFMAVVIGFLATILIVLLATWLVLRNRHKLLPMKTRTVPSQTYLQPLSPISPQTPVIVIG